MVFRAGRKWLEAKRQNQSHNWAKLLKICVSHWQKHVWWLCSVWCLMNLSRKGNAEPSLKAPVLKWVLGVVCRCHCLLLLLSEVTRGSALLECWHWSSSLEIPPNTPVNSAFYWAHFIERTVCRVSLSVAQQQLSLCFADSFHPGAEADTHWRQAEGMSWESAENPSEQNELISWNQTGAGGIGRFEVPNRLCVWLALTILSTIYFFNWNV